MYKTSIIKANNPNTEAYIGFPFQKIYPIPIIANNINRNESQLVSKKDNSFPAWIFDFIIRCSKYVGFVCVLITCSANNQAV